MIHTEDSSADENIVGLVIHDDSDKQHNTITQTVAGQRVGCVRVLGV